MTNENQQTIDAIIGEMNEILSFGKRAENTLIAYRIILFWNTVMRSWIKAPMKQQRRMYALSSLPSRQKEIWATAPSISSSLPSTISSSPFWISHGTGTRSPSAPSMNLSPLSRPKKNWRPSFHPLRT